MTTDTTLGPAYGLTRPTVADLPNCITDASEGDPQLWSQLYQATHVTTDTDDPAALAALIAAALRILTGTARVAVTSLNVRLRAHTALMAR